MNVFLNAFVHALVNYLVKAVVHAFVSLVLMVCGALGARDGALPEPPPDLGQFKHRSLP